MKKLTYLLIFLFAAGITFWAGQWSVKKQSILGNGGSAMNEILPMPIGKGNDFPTAARAEYVYACMGSSGQSLPMLYACACKIDVIAELMSYKDYLQAETGSLMRQLPGERYVGFRNSAVIKKMVEQLKNTAIEAEFRCPSHNVMGGRP